MRATLFLIAALMGLIQNPVHAAETTLAQHLERSNRNLDDVIDRTLNKFQGVLGLYAEASQDNDADAMEILLTAMDAFRAQMTERCMPLDRGTALRAVTEYASFSVDPRDFDLY